MDNIILKGILKDFSEHHELSTIPIYKQFEKFANYCLLKTDYYDSFEFEKVETGNCVGVDGIAIIISGVITNDYEDATKLTAGQFEAKFFFSQIKTSTRFDLGDFLKFVATVNTFFSSNENSIPSELKKAHAIKELIYSRAAKLRQFPIAELSYVYSGKFDIERSQIIPLIENEIRKLKEIPYLFSDVKYNIRDGNAMSELYRETKLDFKKDVSFQRHVALPTIIGAKSAYLGVVSCNDYIRLIQKENGEINRALFFGNVRDFLGEKNAVNEEIKVTIENPDERDRFAILNNGVTIVAKSVTPSGDIFQLERFQIVNGCQTSYVLFNNKDKIYDSMFLTVKLIETTDIDLSAKIIATTNNQSKVTKESLATIKPYHRKIEDFFNAMLNSSYLYYYERRPHQYDHRDDILNQSIVSTPSLIKSFISVVLEEPHQVHYYYGTLLSEYNKNQTSELFSDDDYPGLYFAAHHIVSMVRNKIGRDKRLGDWIFHLALLIKKYLADNELIKSYQKSDKKFLELLANIDDEFDTSYKLAVETLLSLKLHEKDNRLPEITNRLIKEHNAHILRAKKRENKKREWITTTCHIMTNGNYIGVVENVNHADKIITIKYGPHLIEINGEEETIRHKRSQDRILFCIRNGGAVLPS
ncbi:MAG: AIPR family protein [Proteobacteria bacterium]|nr:AIPR family protein [Pseudomonadota bacterium]